MFILFDTKSYSNSNYISYAETVGDSASPSLKSVTAVNRTKNAAKKLIAFKYSGEASNVELIKKTSPLALKIEMITDDEKVFWSSDLKPMEVIIFFKLNNWDNSVFQLLYRSLNC